MLHFLLGMWPGFASIELDKAACFEAVFPGQPYDDKQFRYLSSNLYQLAEQFWVAERQGLETLRNETLLMDCLSQRNLEKEYRQTRRRMERHIKKKEAHNSEYFLQQLQWAEVEESHFERQRIRQYDESIQRVADNLDRYYHLRRLQFSCGMLDRQTIIKGDYELNISSHWLAHLQHQQFFGEPVIELYFTIFQALLDEEDTTHFGRLQGMLAHHAANIAKENLKDIYLFAINYCARKIRQGKENYIGQALQLYLDGIESEILIDNGHLSPWAFTNVVKLALRLRRYQWIEHFIQRYAPALPDAFRENALHYNLAELYYYTRRFDLAQEHLNQVAFSDMNYYLGARVMLAKIYYETEATEPLLSLLAAFTIFLKRNKLISTDLKQTFLNFCDILFQIIKGKRRHWKKLGAKIRNTRLLTDRNWLLSIYGKAAPGV
ncbi:MAG: hypothetical protein H6557_27835 [Lewinellaceae bacterium]|nr:hypothetical protein [Phaeodactylibacter sp.]MCB9040454.1 hypothetical protein [Lewinellaceae bacterium]